MMKKRSGSVDGSLLALLDPQAPARKVGTLYEVFMALKERERYEKKLKLLQSSIGYIRNPKFLRLS